MNLSQPFVRRPIGTVLLTAGVALAGIGAFFVLPVSPLPQVDFPTISVSASLPGASPDTMATSVATVAAMFSGLAPACDALTEMVGKSTCGSGDTGSVRNAIRPASTTAMVSSVVATGRAINGAETFIGACAC